MKYGAGVLDLVVPETLVCRHEAFAGRTAVIPDPAEIDRVVAEELLAAGVGEALVGQHVGLLVADGTREPTWARFVPLLAPHLRGAEAVTAFVCTGTHDPDLPENRAVARDLEDLLAAQGVEGRVLVHDGRRGPFLDAGRTERGTALRVNAASAACDVLLAISNVKNHYFAGYSNPAKYLVPGICDHETARGNHALTLEPESSFGRHPWHPRADRRTNPLAEDMVDALARIADGRPLFAVCAVGGSDRIAWAGAGLAHEVAGRAMEVVDRIAGLELEPARFLVVSPGGHPHDESLYTAQRALELTRHAVLDGGEVLFLARCPNGVGSETARRNFFEPLSRPLEEVCRRPAGPYVLYSHKSYKFALYLSGLEAVHMHSDLPTAEVEAIHLKPAPDPQAVLDVWGSRARAGDAVTLIDDASRFAVHRRAPESGS